MYAAVFGEEYPSGSYFDKDTEINLCCDNVVVNYINGNVVGKVESLEKDNKGILVHFSLNEDVDVTPKFFELGFGFVGQTYDGSRLKKADIWETSLFTKIDNTPV